MQAIDRGDAASGEEVPAEVKEKFAGLLAALKTHLPEVSDVRLTKRLTESAACLVAEAGGVTAHLERILRRAGENVDNNKRVLELNPENAAVAALRELHAASPEDARIATFARLLFEQAVVAEGSRITDPTGFAKRVNELIVTAATKA